MAGVAAVMLAVAAVGLTALGVEGVVRRMFKRRAVDDRGRAERVIVDAREPGSAPPEDPPEWERVTREPWGDAVTEEIDRIKDEEAGVPEGEQMQNVRRVAHDNGQAVISEDASPGHALPAPARGVRVDCHECAGKGFVVKSVNDLLGESLGLIPEGQGDAVVALFYRHLLEADSGKEPADKLEELFPPDLLTAAAGARDSAGAEQRDKLFKVLKALADWYVPDDPASMERLDTALRAYGRSHALFLRPDGSWRGASLQEYAAVELVLFGTLHEVAGGAWRPEYDAAWTEAYDYAAPIMLVEAHRAVLAGEITMPRMPREARDATGV